MTLFKLAVLSALLALTMASPVRRTSAVATIYPKTASGSVTIQGVYNFTLGQDLYLGIPFAEPPVNDLRFKPPQAVTYNSTVSAVSQPPACIQATSASTNSTGYSEDCLALNVYTPAGASTSGEAIPVVVWIYGGGYNSGAINQFNGSAVVDYGSSTGRPVIYVAVQYRVGVLGFGYGKEIAENGAANLGLRDIRLGLEWVKENIRSFGGDPNQVTVWGESAGAMALSLLYLDESIDLFRGAILESGAPTVVPIAPTADIWQGAYDLLVNLTGCAGASGGTFACLKSVPASSIQSAQVTIKATTAYSVGAIWAPSIDNDLIPTSPFKLLKQGKFARVPFINGNNKDEGTLFVPSSINSTAAIGPYIGLYEPNGFSDDVVNDILELYPNVPELGSPYGTGGETFGLSPIFKQIASIFSDYVFQAPRRHFLEQAARHGVTAWTYLFQGDTASGTAAYYGTPHAVDVNYIYRKTTATNGFTASDAALGNTVLDYWFNFIYYLDPNGLRTSTTPTQWPAYGSNASLLVFDNDYVTASKDDYRKEGIAYFNSNPVSFWY